MPPFRNQNQTVPALTQASSNEDEEKQIEARNGESTTFGRAGSRNNEQIQSVQAEYAEILNKIPDNAIVIGTDGAPKGNPGPAGSGVVVLFGKNCKQTATKICAALGSKIGNNSAELYAIGLALKFTATDPEALSNVNSLAADSAELKILEIHILSDSKWSVKALNGSFNAKKHVQLTQWVDSRLHSLQLAHTVHLHWVGGHCGLSLNVAADNLANAGAVGTQSQYAVAGGLYEEPDLNDAAIKIFRNRNIDNNVCATNIYPYFASENADEPVIMKSIQKNVSNQNESILNQKEKAQVYQCTVCRQNCSYRTVRTGPYSNPLLQPYRNGSRKSSKSY